MINNILELNNILKNNTNYKFSNLSKDFAKFLLLDLIKNSHKSSIIVCSNDLEAEQFYNFIKDYSNIDIHIFPSFGIEPYQHVSPNKSLMVKRIDTLSSIYLSKEKSIVVTSLLGIIQKTLAKEYLDGTFLYLKKGDCYKTSDLIDFLVSKNYKKVSLVSEEGEFALRGDILDICSPDIGAIRIDFFDDNIERLRKFDVISQKSYEDIEEINIKPSIEILLNEETIENFKQNYIKHFNESDKELFSLLDKKILPKGIENYIPLFYKKTETILDYIEDYNIFTFDNFDYHIKESVNSYNEEYGYLKNEDNVFKTASNILEPKELVLSEDEVEKKLSQQSRYSLSNTKKDEDNNFNFSVRLFAPEFSVYKNQEKSNLHALVNYIKTNKNKQFLVFVSTDSFSENLRVMLKGLHIDFSLNEEENQQVSIIKNSNIEEGFIVGNKVVIAESEITGVKKTFSSSGKKKSANKILQQLSSIEIGDIVVHIKHGFGQYMGIQTMLVNGADHDFLEIQYKDNEKLYLPVENIDDITRRSSSNPETVLDKLGSTSFEKKSTKIKEKIKDIAYDLIQLAAQRMLKKAPVIEMNTEDYDVFLKGFPYVETEDQKNAIEDVIDDLSNGLPSDRLICGDVGFGKTEVILRGAFLAANSGYQVAVIAPTTLLCNQHYNNFKERFKDFPIRIEQLSRFSSASNRKKYKKELAEGQIDIIIGTHSLLAKDVKFKNLALIIIDEEQSFGVLHKERLKTLKEEVHILTLSATPIPRTIQLAFKGIKELSVISTPPVDKLPIITYVLPVDYMAIKKAIMKEKERDGQIYFVCPRISDIDEIKKSIDSLKLDISYVVAHGQMNTDVLEQNMLDFKDKKYDMLISTNIIESGIDIHNVNTIIILRSDIMGLAQLYQLRGRVGRGQNQAYAYLLYDRNKSLSKKAEKRLQVLQNLDYLGAGFSLATYDLDMRGAGNLLGEEQSGHAEEIGSELYQKLLEQEIKHIKNIKKDGKEDAEYYNFSPNISLNVPVFIPKKYIPDMETSMEIYQRIGRVESYQDIVEVKEELEDRFGTMPYQVENLLKSIELKILAKDALIEKIMFGNKGVQLSFYKQTFSHVDELLDYITSKSGLLILKPEGSIIINTEELEANEKIKLTIKTLEDIAKLRKSQ